MPRSKWTSSAAWVGVRQPVGSATTLPGVAYVDEGFAAIERERVFGRGWVGVALADELREPGRVLVREVAGHSILVTRGGDGVLVGFRNSCRHRGTELLECDTTIGSAIRCPYHKWGYSLDGRLVSTPRFVTDDLREFDAGDHGLHRVSLDEFAGVVFASLDPDVGALFDHLGDLPQRLDGYGVGRWRLRDQLTVDIGANWKLVTENFQEYYHLPWIHPDLATVSRVDDHYRYQGRGMYCGACTTPVSSDTRSDWSTMPTAPDLDDSDATSGRFIAIFPNVLLSVLPNHAFVMLLDPLAPDRTRERCAWLLPDLGPDAEPVSDEAFAVTRAFWLAVNAEDIDIVERAQRGISRGGFEFGRLTPRFEEPLNRFHNMLADRFTGIDRIPDGDASDELDLYGSGVNPLPYLPETVLGLPQLRPDGERVDQG